MDTRNTNLVDELTCQQLVELVTEYLEGAMDSTTQERFATHIALCRPCEEYVDQVRLTIGLLGRLDSDQANTYNPPPKLLEIFRGWREPRAES